MVVIIREAGWVGMLLGIWDSASVLWDTSNIASLLHICYEMFNIISNHTLFLCFKCPIYILVDDKCNYCSWQNSYYRSYKTERQFKLEDSTLYRILECLLCEKFYVLRLLLKCMLFWHREPVDVIEGLDMDM
jgi:hypothetical protein